MVSDFSLSQPCGYIEAFPYKNTVWQLENLEFVSSQLKKFTNNDLLRLAELIVKEMEVRGYGSKKN